MIQIDERHRIDSDKWNWILQEKRIVDEKKDGIKTGRQKEKWMDAGYYNNLKNLILALCEKDLKESNANTLDELKTALFHAENRLKLAVSDFEKVAHG